jgi:hypothetical protein
MSEWVVAMSIIYVYGTGSYHWPEHDWNMIQVFKFVQMQDGNGSG